MNTKWYIISLALTLTTYQLHADIKIKSTGAWCPSIKGSWNKDASLSYANTVYGDTYYNSDWQNTKKESYIDFKSVYRYFYLRPPSRDRNWTFDLPVSNLNAENGYSYSASDTPKKKQSADQIYWGIEIGYKEHSVSRSTRIWIKRSNQEYAYDGYPIMGSSNYISYCIDDNGWEKHYQYYPSCSPSNAPSFKIETFYWGNTNLKWGDWYIMNIPTYIEELTYIKILVGTQAKILIGKPFAFGDGISAKSIYTASDLIQQGNYIAAKNKLYSSDNSYYENQAFNLAYCYANLNEFDKCLEICNALIKFNGETLAAAYNLRGFINEYQGRKLEALGDFQKANDQENYSRLYNEVYPPKSEEHPQQPPQRQNNSNYKPALTK